MKLMSILAPIGHPAHKENIVHGHDVSRYIESIRVRGYGIIRSHSVHVTVYTVPIII